MALNGRQSAKQHTTTNQKQAAATDRTAEGRRDEQETRGKRDTIVSGGGKVQREVEK